MAALTGATATARCGAVSVYQTQPPASGRATWTGGLLVVDAVSHAGQIAAFEARVRADADVRTVRVPIGNGELIAVRSRA